MPEMTPEREAQIRARHDEFERQYSPGHDWQPSSQTHWDRRDLLDALAALRTRLAEVERENEVLRRQYQSDGAKFAAVARLGDAVRAIVQGTTTIRKETEP